MAWTEWHEPMEMGEPEREPLLTPPVSPLWRAVDDHLHWVVAGVLLGVSAVYVWAAWAWGL
jgi:hypothetical protein